MAQFSRLHYDLAEETRFFTVKASVAALVLPLAGRVENQFVLGVELAVVELTPAPIADEFCQNYQTSGPVSLLINSRRYSTGTLQTLRPVTHFTIQQCSSVTIVSCLGPG